jgi:hypothetical protein
MGRGRLVVGFAMGVVVGLVATLLGATPASAVPTADLVARGPAASSPPARTAHPLVTMVRSGGIAGLVDRVTVTRGGRVRVSHRGSPSEAFDLRPGQLTRLRAALDDARLPALKPDYPAPGADMFEYAVTAGGVTVTATETAVPASLRPLIGILLGYLTPRA